MRVTRPSIILRDPAIHRFDRPLHFEGRTFTQLRFAPYRAIVGKTFADAAFARLRLQWQITHQIGVVNWHPHGDWRYAHRWDGHRHWWGFYPIVGAATFYWVVYENDIPWWYEPRWGRYCYWDGTYWRYPVDNGPVLVYDNGNYYEPREGTGGVVLRPTPPQEPPVDPDVPAPPVDVNTRTFYDDANKAAVVVMDDPKGTIVLLYDHTRQDEEGQDLFIAQLIMFNKGVKVDDVEFSEQEQGQPLQITVRTIGNDGKRRSTTFNGETGQRLGGRNAGMELRPEDIGVETAEFSERPDGEKAIATQASVGIEDLSVENIGNALQH